MRRIALFAVLICAVAGIAIAELPAEKQQELNAAGITNWIPGQNAGASSKFSVLSDPIELPAAGATGDTATMVYDDGVISALPTVFGQIFGNRFSLGVSGVPLSTITLNSFSLYFAEDSIADTGLFYQPASPAGATTISARASLNVGGLINAGSSFSMLTTINVVPQSALGTTGMFSNTFFLGAWCLNANTAVPVDNEAIGLATNGGRQQGYTAVSGVGPVAFVPGAFNAVLRANVTSPNTVPVELMAFEVD